VCAEEENAVLGVEGSFVAVAPQDDDVLLMTDG